MSASSRSTIFSIRSKKSKDSTELHTTAGPAYDSLPMSQRPPISVPTIIPPSQTSNGRTGDNTRSKLYTEGGDDYDIDNRSIKSEPRNGYSTISRGGSTSNISLGGGVTGPRPPPPRTGSAEKVHESMLGWNNNNKYNPLGVGNVYHGETSSPNVLSCGVPFLTFKKLHKKRASSDHGSIKSRMSNVSNATSTSFSRAMSPPPMAGESSRSVSWNC